MPEERRVDVIQKLHSLAEDNVDLNFQSVFLACLQDSDSEVRAVAVDGLWEDERLSTLRRLLDILYNDPVEDVRIVALQALARFAYRGEMGELPEEHRDSVHTALLQVFNDPEQTLEFRRRAVEGLGYFARSSEAQAAVERAYQHYDVEMRESAVVAMGRSMRPEYFSRIERELRSPSPALRHAAAQAVGELAEDGQSFLTSLVPLVDDEDLEVALAAIGALGQVGGAHSQRILKRLTRSNDEARRQVAGEALEELQFYEEL
jgi:HEAT repeat protein